MAKLITNAVRGQKSIGVIGLAFFLLTTGVYGRQYERHRSTSCLSPTTDSRRNFIQVNVERSAQAQAPDAEDVANIKMLQKYIKVLKSVSWRYCPSVDPNKDIQVLIRYAKLKTSTLKKLKLYPNTGDRQVLANMYQQYCSNFQNAWDRAIQSISELENSLVEHSSPTFVNALYDANFTSDPDAMARLGFGLMVGFNDVVVDTKQGLYWLNKSIKAQSYWGMYLMALCYSEGLGVTVSNEKAFQLAETAAKNKIVEAMTFVGEAYLDGKGVSRSTEQGVKWCSRAASEGSCSAQMRLGFIYIKGELVPENYRLAFQYFLQAAKQGDDIAQFLVGCLYWDGVGVNKSETEAIKYLRLSAKQGNKDAQKFLAEENL